MEQKIEIGQVWKNRTTLAKRVVRGPSFIQTIQDNPSEFELVADRPHGDEDFSYVCGSDYCKCMQ